MCKKVDKYILKDPVFIEVKESMDKDKKRREKEIKKESDAQKNTANVNNSIND